MDPVHKRIRAGGGGGGSSGSGHVPAHLTWELGFHPGYQAELELKQFLVCSPNESGRGTDLPDSRIEAIRLESVARGFTFTAAMSLRRQLIRQLSLDRPGGAFFYSQKMGDPAGMQEYATDFEKLTEEYLSIHLSVPFRTQQELAAAGNVLTPDIYIPGGCMINGQQVCWIDCKTYYGASSLAPDERLPVGKLRHQCDLYYEAFGPGALLFLNGFSSDLMSQAGLKYEQVLLLDASPLDTSSLLTKPDIHKVELECPLNRIGVLIGKKGATIRGLIERTGCNIVAHPGAEICQVVITSDQSLEEVHAAMPLVMSVIHELQFRRSVLCPATKVGVVIGRQGATVREIMKLSGCSVKTNREGDEAGMQTFHLAATSIPSLDKAEVLIAAVIKNGDKALRQEVHSSCHETPVVHTTDCVEMDES